MNERWGGAQAFGFHTLQIEWPVPHSHPSAMGRAATDDSSDSRPESRRWRFASRKLPLADESHRPVAATQLSL